MEAAARQRDDDIEALRQALVSLYSNPRRIAHLSPGEMAICTMLRHRAPRCVRSTAVLDTLYALRPKAEVPGDDILKVWICRARKKLARHNIKIITHWGEGYSMSTTSAAIWDELIR